MSHRTSIWNLRSHVRSLRKRIKGLRFCCRPSWRGAVLYPPGHFYSPLLDLRGLGPNDTKMPFDGAEWWEHVDLRPCEQRAYYEDLLSHFACLPFPLQRTEGFRYFTENSMFALADAFTLSGIMRKERPSRIIEVGSGYSSAVMLDTLAQTQATAQLTFIEPYPDRLYSLLTPQDRSASTVLVQRVQEVALSVFDQLEANDILFIDSSHVAKIGSDVTYLLLRVLPRLKPGVLVHVHDIFYPDSYPIRWVREGRAWNESLFLRAFLIGNSQFDLVAFNGFAAVTFPEVFRDRFPQFLPQSGGSSGGSLWIRKTA